MGKVETTQVKLYEPSLPQRKALDIVLNKQPFITCLNYGRQTGKAQLLTAKIYTKDGYKSMKDIRVGDKILASNGRDEQEVLAIHPQGKIKAYRVVFRDRTSVIVNDAHEWTVTKRDGTRATLTTKEMLDNGVMSNYPCSTCEKNIPKSNYYVDTVKMEWNPKETIIREVLLMIGLSLRTIHNREFKNIEDTSAFEEIAYNYMQYTNDYIEREDDIYSLTTNGKSDLLDLLKELDIERDNLIDKLNVKDREIIKEGLLATGTILYKGAEAVLVSDKKHATSVAKLFTSLGYAASIIRRFDNTYVAFANEEENPDVDMMLKYRAITNITPLNADAEMQCITVSGSDSLYITDHYIITHNSYMSLMDMIYRGMNATKPIKIRFVVPVYSLAKKHMQTIDAMFQGYEDVKAKIFKQIKYKEQEYHFHNGTVAAFLSAESEDALRGDTAHFMYIDEAAFIKETTYTEILLPMLTRTKGRILMFSTPNGKNWFYKLYQRGLPTHKQYNPNQIISLRADYRDLSGEKDYEFILKTINALRQSMTVASFNREVLAEFVSDQSLFKGVSERTRGEKWYEDYLNSERGNVGRYIGIDIGVVGDYTVMTALDDNLVVVDIDRFNMQNENYTHTEFKDRIKRFILKHKHRLVAAYMETNNKELLYDELSSDEELYMLMPVNTNMRTKPAMVDALIKRFDDEEIIIPDNEDLQEELYAFSSVQNAITGRVQYKGSEGQHDDMVMSLVIANACRDEEGSSGFTEVY